jgi:hypothetical protein
MENSQDLQILLNHPKRNWFIFGLCGALALLWGLPATEKYYELNSRETELQKKIAAGANEQKSLARSKQILSNKQTEVAALRAKTMSQENIQEFRDQIVGIARDSGCTMRRIKIADTPNKRDWYENDAPLDNRVHGEKEKKTPFKLQSQQLTVQVTGPMENVLQLLEKLATFDKLSETTTLNLKRSVEDQSLIEMDLEMLLFDLVKAGLET